MSDATRDACESMNAEVALQGALPSRIITAFETAPMQSNTEFHRLK